MLSDRTALRAATEGKKRGTPRKMETTTPMQVPLLLPQREKVADGRMRGTSRKSCNRGYDDDLAALLSDRDDAGAPRGPPHPAFSHLLPVATGEGVLE